jgi:hypothetical protein
MSDRNEAVIAEFRMNGGEVKAFAEQPLLLLTHRGARTGTERTNPVAYFPDDERYVIVVEGRRAHQPRLAPQPGGEPEGNHRGRDRAVRRTRPSRGGRRTRASGP